MRVETFEFNPLGVNTYVLYDETRECAVIDAACFYPDEEEQLTRFIADNGLVVKQLLNTHLHFDHLMGVNFISSTYNVPLSCHEGDRFLMDDLPRQLMQFGLPPLNYDIQPKAITHLKERDRVSFGNQLLEVKHLPGHSPGSLVFYSATAACLFVGDVLFHSSIGRTDLYGGSYETLAQGIREKLFTLPDETIVYPGHGPATTIGYEKRYNPFVGQIR